MSEHPDIQALVLRACSALFEPGQVTELRAFVLGRRGYTDTLTGYFDDFDRLAAEAARIDAAGSEAVYVVLNPVRPDLLARAANRTRRAKRGEATANADVTARRWLFLDFDPVRPSGISSTDAEHAAALERARACRDFLASLGFPPPLLADSGNGAHLLYRLDLDADDGGLVQRCLAALADLFSDDEVEVDTTVHNAARLCKLYGTTARKGDPTDTRPHRRSALLDVPEELLPVPPRLLEALAAKAPTNGETTGGQAGGRGRDTLGVELTREALSFIPPRPRYDSEKESSGFGWVETIAAVLHAVGDDELAAEMLLSEWSAEEEPGEYARKLANPLQRITTGSLIHHAERNGWVPPWKRNHDGRTRDRERTRENGAGTPGKGNHDKPVDEDSPPLGVLVADVERESVAWLWPGRLALGKLTILDGDPGLGKSTLYCDLAARLTRGTDWPDGVPVEEAAGVVIVTTEDGIGDTIRPRLEEAGADVQRVSVVQLIPEADGPGRVPVLPDDNELLFGECRRIGARLLVVDPLMAHLGSDTNSYRDQDVRRALAPLSEAAERYGVAVVVLRHLNKATGGSALYRGGGSIGIIGAARVGLMAGRDPADENLVVLACSKNNIAARPDSLAFRLVSSPNDPGTAVIRWEGTSPLSAEDLCRPAPSDSPARDEAQDWLEAELEGGPRPAADLYRAAEAAGITEATLKRAKRRLNVESKRVEGAAGDGYWVWELPRAEKAKGGNQAGKPKVLIPGGEHLSTLSGDGWPSATPADPWESEPELGEGL